MKGLLLRHGEKAILAVVGLLCLWSMYGTITNEETITEAKDEELVRIDQRLQDAERNPGTPNFHEVRDFKGELLDRFRLQVEPALPVSFLWEHPDIGDTGAKPPPSGEPYIYEVGKPSLDAKARVGQIEVVLAVPPAQRRNEERDFLKDDPAGVSWTQQDMINNQVQERKNSARVVGALVEMRVGGGAFAPLVTEGVVDGWVPLGPGQGFADFSVSGLVEGQTYGFRARLVAKATGPGPDEQFTLRREVLVVSPQLPVKEAGLTREAALEWQTKAVEDTLPVEAPALAITPSGVTLSEWENLFQGVQSEAVTAEAPSSVLIALDRATTFGGQQSATLLVMKLEDVDGDGEREWVGPVDYKLEPGDPIGEPNQAVEFNGVMVQLDFTTPYKLKAIEQAERTLYYELDRRTAMDEDFQPIPGPDGQPFKRMELKSKTSRTDVVVLEHTVKGTEVRLVELENRPIRMPSHPRVSPLRGDQERSEREVFTTDPEHFTQPVLTPPAPKRHDNHRLLERLADLGLMLPARVKQIELPYWELPDGRVFAWDTLNPAKEFLRLVIPGSAADRAAQGKDAKKPAAEEPVEAP